MMRIELANGTKIKLPPGNKWTLEGSIPRLEAGGVKYPYKIIDLSKASPPMQRVVQVMQNQFLLKLTSQEVNCQWLQICKATLLKKLKVIGHNLLPIYFNFLF